MYRWSAPWWSQQRDSSNLPPIFLEFPETCHALISALDDLVCSATDLPACSRQQELSLLGYFLLVSLTHFLAILPAQYHDQLGDLLYPKLLHLQSGQK